MTVVDINNQIRAWALAEAGKQAFGQDFGIDITPNLIDTAAGPQVAYLIYASCRSPLLGNGPLFSVAQLPTPQPSEQQIAEAITGLLRNLRDLSAQALKTPRAGQNGHG
jgi:hypothetical protein